MSTPFKIVLVLAGLAVLLLLGFDLYRTVKENTELQDQITLLRHSVTHTDSIYHVDTLRLAKAEIRYRIAHDTVLARLTDTVSVVRFMAVADSTIKACQAVVQDCEARVAARDSLIRVLQKAAVKHWYDRVGVTTGVGCAAGLSGRSACGAVVGATIRIFP